MVKGEGESPELLLPNKENFSDRVENPTGINQGNGVFIHSHHHQQQPEQSMVSIFGLVSPVHHQHHNITNNNNNFSAATCSSSVQGIPLSPLLPLRQDHPGSNLVQTAGHVQVPTSGIMPLTNFNFSSNNNSTTPPRKLSFNSRSSPKMPSFNIAQGVPAAPPPIRHPNNNNNYPYSLSYPEHRSSSPGFHNFGRIIDGPRVPWMIPSFLVIQGLLFVITMYENNCPQTPPEQGKCVLRFLGRLSFQPLNENPLLGPSYKALLSMGALQSTLVTTQDQGWRLLTCIWLHAGIFHLLSNVVGLLSIGLRLEREFGWVKVGTIYVISGFGGSLLSALFMQRQISVGASGALMGLLGASVAEILINWSIYQKRSRALAAILLAVAVNLSFGLMPHVDNFAHLGGLSAGMLLGTLFLIRPRFTWVNQMVHDLNTLHMQRGSDLDTLHRGRLSKHTRLQTVAWFVALGFLLICYGAAMLALFKGYGLDTRKTCKWCHYMSCVPSFLWQCHAV